MCFCDFVECTFLFAGHAIQIKQQCYAAFALRLVFGLQYPRCFLQQSGFQFLIFFQVRQQCIGLNILPCVKHLLDAWIGIGDMRCNTVRIKLTESLLYTVIRILHQVRQCLNGIPCGIGSELQREAVMTQRGRFVVDKLLELKFFGLLTANGQWHCFCHQHAVGHHRNGHLFSIRKITSFGYYTIRDGLHTFRNFNTPLQVSALTWFQRKIFCLSNVLHLRIDRLHGQRVKEFQLCLSG